MLNSPLYQRARSAGGSLAEVHEANPARLYADLASLYKASDAVLLVHIDRSGSELSTSGSDVLTEYTATVVIDFYGGPAWGANGGATVRFFIPTGMIAFDQNTRAAVSVHNFLPLADGKRYLVFLRSATGDAGRLDPGFRLTGDGVQGAFEVTDEKVAPNFHGDALWQKYKGASVATLVGDVRPFTSAAIDAAAAGRPYVVGKPDFDDYRDIRVRYLQEAGLHLPSYMPTIWQLRQYLGERLATHQQLTVTWDSLPGVSDPDGWGAPYHTVRNLPLSPDFVLVDRKHNLPGAPGYGQPNLGFLIQVGITSSSEVRSLTIRFDPRERNGEASCGIHPKVTFDVRLPDDPEIKTLIFFKPVAKVGYSPPEAALEKIGAISIPAD
jgi:hypothetical protein